VKFAIAILSLSALSLSNPRAAQQPVPAHVHDEDSKLAIKVTLDGQPVKFTGTVPVMFASRVLVPLRGVFEQMGATLTWDAASRTVTATDGERHVVLPLGKNQAEIDGKTVALDQPATSIEGRTMVPLRFLGQALGASVEWLDAERTVAIKTSVAKS